MNGAQNTVAVEYFASQYRNDDQHIASGNYRLVMTLKQTCPGYEPFTATIAGVKCAFPFRLHCKCHGYAHYEQTQRESWSQSAPATKTGSVA
jgi:hypothetical protein